MNDLKKALAKEQFNNDIFPSLLMLKQELPTWKARADALNAANLTTFYAKPWTRQNVHKAFYSFWDNDLGRYSWVEHNHALQQLAKLVK
jgi:hypothetical protein